MTRKQALILAIPVILVAAAVLVDAATILTAPIVARLAWLYP